jgi:hypothetical protein
VGEPTGRHVFCSYWPYFGNNAPTSDLHRPDTLRKIQKKCANTRQSCAEIGILLISAAAFSGCIPADQAPPSAIVSDSGAGATTQNPVLKCGTDGELHGRLYGAIDAQLDWENHDLECSGMPRPEGHGARLHFAGTVDGNEQRVAMIVAIPDLGREALGREYRSNVTIIEEGVGRFFSTPDLENCLTDITSLIALDDTGDRFSLGGLIYCVTPLPEVNGESSISIPELRFHGLLDWSSS